MNIIANLIPYVTSDCEYVLKHLTKTTVLIMTDSIITTTVMIIENKETINALIPFPFLKKLF